MFITRGLEGKKKNSKRKGSYYKNVITFKTGDRLKLWPVKRDSTLNFVVNGLGR